jgi:hypothetical protein
MGFRVYKWFFKHFREAHLPSFDAARAQADSSDYMCSGQAFATLDALISHIWETYTVPIQPGPLTQASHTPFTAPSTPLPSGTSTPVPPASQAHANPLFTGSTGAVYAPMSVPGSSSVQPNHYPPSLASNNMPANAVPFIQPFHYPTDEKGTPLPPQNGNPAGYPRYTNLWNATTQ